ncbi:hypothetical protein IV417_18450 [Alphaproteobacteria bacterium KMM 3653]|uniref:Tyrosine specific protein phosphatases domain-containing protein n=1 Tax=Harenicola maris TaxID=2841044 RepID=A0AAP2CVN3_9RHOB|nr:hypothetical protein [Harenicola maris]
MAGFPGLETSVDGSAYIDAEAMALTTQKMAKLGAKLFVILTEEQELPEGSFAFLQQAAGDSGLTLHFMPIVDFEVPRAEFMAKWPALWADIRARLVNGETVACSCQYGAGRSGLLAAFTLIEQGMEPQDAIALVRSHFDEAIESTMQEDWLTSIKATS